MGVKNKKKQSESKLKKHVRRFLKNNAKEKVKGNPGDWMGDMSDSKKAAARLAAAPMPRMGYDPDESFEKLASTPVKNPVIAFNEALEKGKVAVAEAWMFEGCFDERGKLIENKELLNHLGLVVPYRIRYVEGSKYLLALKDARKVVESMPGRRGRLEEAKRKHLEAVEKLKSQGLIEDDFNTDTITRTYDANQYTEYTPLYGGPFNKQLYLYDYLSMHAKAFEAKNHNPIAKRIVDVLAQYAFGRRFQVRIKNERKKKVWEEFDTTNKIVHKLSEFWAKEYLTYGELMLDKTKWQSIDPSTVWDIITDPDDISKVYYYYQSYSTAFQTFTGYAVRGEPGSKNQAPIQYIIRQLPATQVLHIKGNVVSQEKRGRSILFPILGWLKRVKDYYNARVIRAQLEASFIWDDTIDGNAGDVQAHAATYSSMPLPASIFVHNKAVERKPMPAIESQGRGGSGGGISDDLLAFIATAVGIPKEFFNVVGAGSGNRATALVGSEPFEKVIEDLQAKFENLLLSIAEDVFVDAGVGYKKGDVEFTFPSVTKDTTSETIKNIGTGESMGYIDHQMAAEMFAAEMNITTYNYKDVQEKIKQDKENGIDPMMPPDGRFGRPSPFGGNVDGAPVDGDEVPEDVSPIKGQGKNNLKRQMNQL